MDDAGIPHEELSLLQAELGPDLEFLGMLGKGRWARVYLAREIALDRLVAVKVLEGRLSDDPVAMVRFEREAKAAAAMDHPHAVTVYRTGILSNHIPFQVMQYVKGGTLENRVAAEGPLPEADARRVLAEIADALDAAHKRGFVHRDLRPDNVLCDDEQCRVLVSDFGLAGLMPHARSGEPRVTQTGEVLSNPEYASPELLRGEDLSGGTDIYALGVLGYKILTGEGPFPAAPGRALIAAHLRQPPRPLATLKPDIAPDLASLLERCLAKEPGKRPTAAFVARALREPVGAGAGGAVGRQGAGTAVADNGIQGVIEGLLQRRLPYVVVATAVIGWFVQEVVGNQVDLGYFPRWTYPLAWKTVICAVAASGIVAWFHGRKGRQRVTAMEVLLLTALGILWIAWVGLSLII